MIHHWKCLALPIHYSGDLTEHFDVVFRSEVTSPHVLSQFWRPLHGPVVATSTSRSTADVQFHYLGTIPDLISPMKIGYFSALTRGSGIPVYIMLCRGRYMRTKRKTSVVGKGGN